MELLSDTAFISSWRLVISTMNDCRAGMSKAIARPPSAASARMCHGRICPLQVKAANTKASSIMAVWVKQTTVRLGCRSATEPPQTESSNGKDPAAATVPSRTFEPVN